MISRSEGERLERGKWASLPAWKTYLLRFFVRTCGYCYKDDQKYFVKKFRGQYYTVWKE